MKFARRFERGATALEFALMTPFILILLLGTIDISLETMLDSLLEHGVQSATRIGVTVAVPTGKTREQAIYDTVWLWVGDWLQNQSQLTINAKTYTSYSDIGQPEPCGDDSYKNTGTCTGKFTDVNGNGVWDADMGSSGAGGYGSIVRYQVTLTRPGYTGILQLLNIKLFTLQRTIVVQNEPQSSS